MVLSLAVESRQNQRNQAHTTENMFDSIADIPIIPSRIKKKREKKAPLTKDNALRNVFRAKRKNIINKRKQNGR